LASVIAQYSGPESVVFDYENNRYFIANYYGGSIIETDLDGNPVGSITGQGHCLGMCIVDTVLYVSCNTSLRGFRLTDFEMVMNITFPLYGHLDGIATDGSGYIYVVDTGGLLLKVNLTSQEALPYMYLQLPGNPQDCVYDPLNNRIVVVTYATNPPIRAIDLNDSSHYDPAPCSFGYWDGITIDDSGNFYLSSHTNGGSIYKFNNDFSGDPDLVSQGHDQPAGLTYNNRDDVLVVPNFGSNTVSFIQIETAISDNSCDLPDNYNLSLAYPNPFNSSTTISYSLLNAGDVELCVYDIIGCKVGTIFKGFQAAGNHSVNWNAGQYCSGIYYCTIASGFNTDVVKMTFLK
jgi:hypothetical protein